MSESLYAIELVITILGAYVFGYFVGMDRSNERRKVDD